MKTMISTRYERTVSGRRAAASREQRLYCSPSFGSMGIYLTFGDISADSLHLRRAGYLPTSLLRNCVCRGASPAHTAWVCGVFANPEFRVRPHKLVCGTFRKTGTITSLRELAIQKVFLRSRASFCHRFSAKIALADLPGLTQTETVAVFHPRSIEEKASKA